MSIVHFMAFPEAGAGEGPILASVTTIAEDDFFDAVELAWIRDHSTRRRVRKVLDVAQLRVGFGAHPAILSQKLNLNSLDEAKRHLALHQMKELLDQAGELGAERFVFLSGPDPGDGARQQAIEALIDSTCEMCAYAQEMGISLTLETFDREVDKKALVGPVRDAASVARAVRARYPDFGLLYDLSHMPILDESPEDMSTICDYLVQVHVGNCVKMPGRQLYGDLHPHFGFAGGENGVAELAKFVRALFEIGYLAEGRDPRPWIGFEVKPQGDFQSPELVIANAKRTWRQAWTLV
jgi:sugar phosphate isomerase/epimerase